VVSVSEMPDDHVPEDVTADVPNPRAVDVDDLQPFGLGWRWQWRVGRTWVRMTFRSMRKGTTGPTSEVTVDAGIPSIGVKGTLTVERLSLGDGNGRVKLANRLSKRTGEGPDAPVDWRSMIDGICSRILVAQQAGPEVRQIGLEQERAANWLVEGLVEQHQTTSIYADGETGKSWLSLAACVSFMTGEEIVPGWRPLSRGRALYLDWETDWETMNGRVRMICRGAGIPYVPIGYVACDGPLIDQLEWLLEKVHDEDIGLIVVDSVEAAMAGSRSDGGDMNDTASKMNQVLRKIGRSALLVDHVNSQNAAAKGLAGKAYGSIFKRNWVRMSYEIKRVHDGAEGDKHLGVYCTKRNNGPRFDAFGLAWTINDELASWQREEISEPTLTAALPVKKRIEIALNEDSPLSVSSLAEVCEAPLGTIRVELSRDKGKTFRKNSNDMWELAPRMRIVNAAQEEPGDLPW
jgi:hypothetical protein